jgi:hypothetical protein
MRRRTRSLDGNDIKIFRAVLLVLIKYKIDCFPIY